MIAVCPVTLREARSYVEQYHRHHRMPQGGLFAIGATDGESIRGVAIVGKPVARMLSDGWTAEVVRPCTDGTRNACSMLYSACWRAARAMGYRRLITYTLPEEGGASLLASNWRCIGEAGGGSWSRKDRPRVDTHPTQSKLRWQVDRCDPCTPRHGRDRAPAFGNRNRGDGVGFNALRASTSSSRPPCVHTVRGANFRGGDVMRKWMVGDPIDQQCTHSTKKTRAQVIGVCIDCWRDRAETLHSRTFSCFGIIENIDCQTCGGLFGENPGGHCQDELHHAAWAAQRRRCHDTWQARNPEKWCAYLNQYRKEHR